ncbi:NADH-quinone oxidoreductase subunit N [Euryarchaeota archaeon]|nr:NADH-quinone oxidoreductase subunit N [Euryarchaeota archaeon]MDA8609659.1 NADH-quinone oxidoreductase subunit N [Euryarchaeota archaeon]MDA8680092.1 NADH-quinone oxidoreductase subunit N [Euryarchaeota archaeon]MDA9828762.1 NADH-quinone oxidoreductase subunit N [Candidatus Poseidoniaceae archaeon]
MSNLIEIEPFGEGFIEAMGPELILFAGMLLLIIVPNLGKGTFRIPGTQIRLPWLLGGERFEFTSDPRLPAWLATFTLGGAFLNVLYVFSQGLDRVAIVSESGKELLLINGFSRIFELIFFGALALAAFSSMNRLRVNGVGSKVSETELFNNRRQADFYILMVTCALGMSVVALAQDLFVLFIGLELASFSTYVLVAFLKESKVGVESGMKYFIVGSVASGVGLYGLSMLYLWAGSLQFDVLATAFATTSSTDMALPLIGIGFVLVGFGFKVSAAPFHFAAPDAYAGATSPVAGVLATASKAMGMIGLVRMLLIVAAPETGDGSAIWLVCLGVLAAVTMTWGNLAALGSDNPKRMLAYSSVAHAGYMLAALTAVGAWNWDAAVSGDAGAAAVAVMTAVIFHLLVLVAFKLGAFLVLSILESEGDASRLSSLGGLAKREPLLAVSMFIFMISLAGVPPMAGFLSKLLVIMGIVRVAVGDMGAELADGGIYALGDMHWVWWLALLMVLNSAISMFYYLRVGVVMFFDEPEEGREGPLPSGWQVRAAIFACVLTTLIIGVAGDAVLRLCEMAAQSLNYNW